MSRVRRLPKRAGCALASDPILTQSRRPARLPGCRPREAPRRAPRDVELSGDVHCGEHHAAQFGRTAAAAAAAAATAAAGRGIGRVGAACRDAIEEASASLIRDGGESRLWLSLSTPNGGAPRGCDAATKLRQSYDFSHSTPRPSKYLQGDEPIDSAGGAALSK